MSDDRAVATPEGLICFIRSEDRAIRIAINATHRASRPVNRLLFGKFTEHLGHNIYNGMWAQILQNTSFADWSYFRHVWSRAAARHPTGFPLDRILAAYDRGLACWWTPYGAEDAAYLVDWRSPFNSLTSQRVTVPADAAETGIAQPIYLPIHRVRSYTATFYARGRTDGLRVSLVEAETGDPLTAATAVEVEADWKVFTAQLTIPADALAPGSLTEFRVGLLGGGQVWLDQVFLFPDDHVSGFDPDVVRLLREAKLPLLRYPGGNFVSGYHWQDGVGPVHERPVQPNPAWDVLEPNHVGTDEFMAFCAAVGCEPMICVNAGNGTPQEAARWVEYCNGSTDTEFGSLRARNGHPEPYDVRYWEIGNELWGRWQIGHCTPEEYAERYEAFRRAMLDVAPDLLLIANGQSFDWNRPLVERKGRPVRSLSLHTLIGAGAKEEPDPEAVFRALMAYTTAYDSELQALGRQTTACGDVRIAVTELQVFTNVPHLPNNATQSESLFLAGIIHSALRQGELVEMITHSALVNHGGGLRKEREIVYPNPVHWVSHLYGNLSEVTLVRCVTEGTTFSADLDGIASGTSFPVLDVVAVQSEDAGQLIVLVINRHPWERVEAGLKVAGFSPAPEAVLQTISGDSYMARNTWEVPDEVGLQERTMQVDGPAFTVSFPPHSVNALTLTRAGE